MLEVGATEEHVEAYLADRGELPFTLEEFRTVRLRPSPLARSQHTAHLLPLWMRVHAQASLLLSAL